MISNTLLTSIMQFTSLFVMACCIFLISSLVTAATFLAHRKYVSALNHRVKNSYLFFHGLSAVLASIVVTVWLSLPHTPRLPLVFDHCHSDNCATHIPAIIDPSLLNLLFAFFVVGLIAVSFLFLKAHQKKLAERINSLLRLSDNQYSDQHYWSQATVINVPQAVLLNVGMFSPKLILSSVIIESLDAHDVKLLLAYEYAKAKQFENLKVKLLQVACLFWPAKVRKILINDLQVLLRARASSDIYQQLGHQQSTISQTTLKRMPKDTRNFLLKIAGNNHHTSESIEVIADNNKLTNMAYLISFSYSICLVIVTSNFTHFLFELIG